MKEINVIVAMTKSRVIGKDGKLPWHLSEDLKLFKAHTTGNIVIMGRKTFDSIGRPLPNRRNIVVSKSIRADEKVSGVEYFPDLEHAVSAAQEGEGRIFIIGGASIYHQMIERADRLYISLVDGEFEGDTYFPEIKDDVWKVVATEPHTGFELKIYEKR
ncbi:MAG: dihydrofolate reductase [Spirochaetia bacterium]|nr:dihydrofolate reductase [Spirochaetia bacterium]